MCATLRACLRMYWGRGVRYLSDMAKCDGSLFVNGMNLQSISDNFLVDTASSKLMMGLFYDKPTESQVKKALNICNLRQVK